MGEGEWESWEEAAMLLWRRRGGGRGKWEAWEEIQVEEERRKALLRPAALIYFHIYQAQGRESDCLGGEYIDIYGRGGGGRKCISSL